MRKRRLPIVLLAGVALSSAGLRAAVSRIRPAKEGRHVVLFHAGRQAPGAISHYTTRWRKGSDLTPAGRLVRKDDQPYIEISCRGKTGAACSTMHFEKMPRPAPGRVYAGLRLTLDCDRDDYPHISVAANFSDDTQLTTRVTLERGRHEYVVRTGFRRGDFRPRWEFLRWVWLSATAGGTGNDLVFRLRRIELLTGEAKPLPATRPAADYFGRPLLRQLADRCICSSGSG